LGIAFDIAVEELVARMPTLQETMTLRLVPGTPVVELIRTVYAKDENLIECLSSSSRPTVTVSPTSSPWIELGTGNQTSVTNPAQLA